MSFISRLSVEVFIPLSPCLSSLAGIMHHLSMPGSFSVHLVLFFSAFFPCLFLPKHHTISYPHYHLVLFFPSTVSQLTFPCLPHQPCLLFSPFLTGFLSFSFYHSKAPLLLMSNVFGIIRPVYSKPPHPKRDLHADKMSQSTSTMGADVLVFHDTIRGDPESRKLEGVQQKVGVIQIRFFFL